MIVDLLDFYLLEEMMLLNQMKRLRLMRLSESWRFPSSLSFKKPINKLLTRFLFERNLETKIHKRIDKYALFRKGPFKMFCPNSAMPKDKQSLITGNYL